MALIRGERLVQFLMTAREENFRGLMEAGSTSVGVSRCRAGTEVPKFQSRSLFVAVAGVRGRLTTRFP
jgi:hypothetical protein